MNWGCGSCRNRLFEQPFSERFSCAELLVLPLGGFLRFVSVSQVPCELCITGGQMTGV